MFFAIMAGSSSGIVTLVESSTTVREIVDFGDLN